MPARPDATLNLSSLLSHDPGSYEVSGEGALMPEAALLEADGLRLDVPLEWQLEVQSTGGDDDFILTGKVAGTALMECRRCLEDVPVALESSFIYPMIYRPGAEGLELLETEEDEDTLVFGQPQVDFAELLTQLFAIDLPLTALCREECRGLSAEGVNLNLHPEAAERPEAEPDDEASPFAPLKKLEL